MKIRNDSPFAVLTKDQVEYLRECMETDTVDDIAGEIEQMYPKLNFSTQSLKRFLRRLKEDGLREEAEDSAEAMEALGKVAAGGKARDGIIETVRQKLYGEALDAEGREAAEDLFKVLSEEKREDRRLALEERRIALEEEKARQAARRLELGAAKSALALLPRLAAILIEAGEGVSAEEKVARAREVLLGGGGRLLGEGGGIEN